MNRAIFLLVATACLSAACGGKAPDDNADATAVTAAGPPRDAADPPTEVAPAIISPEHETDQSMPPSYEVAVASAAADHNKAKERCAQQPKLVQAQCEQEANAAFSDARQNLERLRGNTQ
jgi:hypothetical protein